MLIVNPSSGGEKAKSYQEKAMKKLKAYFDSVDLKLTEKEGDAVQFSKQAAKEQYHSIFVMGGDGTVNEGINGIAEQAHRPHFGFFPLGTVNDLARVLKMPLDPEEAISKMSFEETSDLDIGRVNEHYFMNVIAIGTIPESVNDVDPNEKTKFGKLAYFISGFKNMVNNEAYHFQVDIDGKKQEIKTSTILIGLTNSIGGFEQLIPEAKVDDGKLHFVYLKDQTFMDTVKAIPSLVTGVYDSDQNVSYHVFEKASISTDQKGLTINVDGDEGDELPITVSVLPSHLTIYTCH
ncbi:YegS//BmrU family lipid kinase [Streptococcus urinalis FB127-CNA-2]|nr:YegS//BmrU family lipid kinase [Streptococcus urinalis FB127-CNA-2]VEF31049.1 transcriptional regulator [Streptococcus urinalis]